MVTKHIQKILFLAIAIVPVHLFAITTYYSPRSQGMYTPRYLCGQLPYLAAYCNAKPHAFLSAAVEYTQSFKSSAIRKALFGTSNQTAVTISGSTVPNRNNTSDWLADNFYLPPDFQSSLTFKPRVDNIIIDFNGYYTLDEWYPGLYAVLLAPLVHTRWNLHLHEKDIKPGVAGYPAGYFTPQALSRGALLNSFTQYAQGIAPEPAQQLVNPANPTGQPIIVNFGQLNNARMSTENHIKTAFGELRGLLGFNFLSDYCSHLGTYVVMAAPTSNRPVGKYLFEPIAGNGHHTELGIGFQGHYSLSNDTNYSSLMFYADINLTHIFGTRQHRTFDLKNRPFSRYLLAEKIGASQNNLSGQQNGTSTPVALSFANSYNPVANLSTISVHVRSAAQCEITALLSLSHAALRYDVGYNFWARSCDKIKLDALANLPLNGRILWAIKSDAHVFGFASGTSGTIAINDAIPLSATESTATISSTLDSGDTAILVNTGIDNPQPAFAGMSPAIPLLALPNAPGGMQNIETSVPPVLLSINDLDLDSSKTKGMSSSVFGSITYEGEYNSCKPYLTMGGQIEIGTQPTTKFDHCVSCSLSQWGIWLRAGIAFD
jgi:hypothetical protein